MKQSAISISGNEFFSCDDFRLTLMQAHCCENDTIEGNYTYINHYHSFSEIVLITSGNALQNINGVDYNVGTGDLFMLEGEMSHHFQPGKNFSIVNVLFDKSTLGLPWSLFRRLEGYNIFFEVEPKFRNLKNFNSHLKLNERNLEILVQKFSDIDVKLSQLRRSGTVYDKLEVLSLFAEIIVFIARLSEKHSAKTESATSGISRAITEIETRFEQNLTISDLAELTCTSPRNFFRQFRRATSQTPTEYLIRIRMKHALNLLKNPQFSIDAIAGKCGFADSCYFSKCFSSYFGVSARQYRKYFHRTQRDDILK